MTNENTMKWLYENFIQHYPYMKGEIIKCEMIDKLELLITTLEGDQYIYYMLDGSLHKYNKDESNYGNVLRGILLKKGMYQKMLSDKTGLSCAIISKYLTGKSEPTYTNAVKIADALGCKLDDFRIKK